MRGGAVFLSFFILFTLASLAVPVPLFPGNLFPAWFGVSSAYYGSLFSAVVNGVTYGFLVWLVFVVATRGLEESGVANYNGKKRSSKDSNKRRGLKR